MQTSRHSSRMLAIVIGAVLGPVLLLLWLLALPSELLHRIHRAKSLRSWLQEDEAARTAFGAGSVRDQLALPPGAQAPHPRYLAHHRARWQSLYA